MTEYINFEGLIYTVSKDAWAYVNEVDVENKKLYKKIDPVEIDVPLYFKDSGLDKKWKDEGYQLRWALKRNIPTLQLDGWQPMYVTDVNKKEIYALRAMKAFLMGKKEESDKA